MAAYHLASDFTNVQTERWQRLLSPVTWTYGEIKSDEIRKARYVYLHKVFSTLPKYPNYPTYSLHIS